MIYLSDSVIELVDFEEVFILFVDCEIEVLAKCFFLKECLHDRSL